MKNSIKNRIVDVISNNLVYFFANSITASDFVENHIKSITDVTEKQETRITDILFEYKQDWDNVDCDSEGATKKQDSELDSIIDKCTQTITYILT
jgi:hypothetical protein